MDASQRAGVVGRLRNRAVAQHGVVLVADLADAGVTRRMRERMVREGFLSPMGMAAYSLGGQPPGPWTRAVAATMLAGPDSVASHYTAAGLHRLPHLVGPDRPEVTVRSPRHPRRRGVIVHRVLRLDGHDVELRRGVRMTTASRTLVDLEPDLNPTLLARILDEGAVMKLWTPGDLAASLARSGRRSARLTHLIEARAGSGAAENVFERRVYAALRGVGRFVAQYQLVLEGRVLILDLALPELRVAVECDGWAVRSRSRGKFDSDRRRNNLLAAHGWNVVHVTSDMSDEEVRASVVKVMLLAARRDAGTNGMTGRDDGMTG